MDCAPGELAVADFAATGTAHAASFTDRVWREVVMQHEGFFVFSSKAVDDLFVIAGAEGRYNQSLCFATCKQRRAVNAGEDADFSHDRADSLGVAAIDTVARVEDAVADDIRFNFLAESFDNSFRDRCAVLDAGFNSFCFRSVFLGVTGLFFLDGISSFEFAFNEAADFRLESLLVESSSGNSPRLFRALFSHLDDRVDDRLEAFPAEHDGVQHDFFGEFMRFGFNHQHAFFRTGDDEVQFAVLHFVVGRVQDVFAVDVADAGRTDRTHERDAGDGEGSGSADQACDICFVLQVIGNNRGDNLCFVQEALREERADRAVDQAGDQCLAFCRAAFALEEATGYLSCGEILLLVVNGEGEEILARLLFAGGNGRYQNGAFAEGHEYRAISLTSHLARFKGQLLAGPVQFLFSDVKHLESFSYNPRLEHSQRFLPRRP